MVIKKFFLYIKYCICVFSKYIFYLRSNVLNPSAKFCSYVEVSSCVSSIYTSTTWQSDISIEFLNWSADIGSGHLGKNRRCGFGNFFVPYQSSTLKYTVFPESTFFKRSMYEHIVHYYPGSKALVSQRRQLHVMEDWGFVAIIRTSNI
jgi:hypothetical protein